MGFIAIFCFVVYFKAKKVDPLARPRGIMLLAEMYVSLVDNLIDNNLGKQYRKIGGAVFGFLMPYLFLCMIFGLFGVESPTTYLYVPLTLGLTTFVLIHATAVYYNKWKYFKNY